jgi:DNA-binding GntR family transcriptional regulator
MGAVLQSAGQREAIWDEHETIANAIKAGDVSRAVALSDEHAIEARQNLVSRLNEVLSVDTAADRRRTTTRA